jgi:hypothetical protein
MKAASIAALALAGLFATTASLAQERAVTDEPPRTQEGDAQSQTNDTHGYENANPDPSASSPDPRLDEREAEDRREHTDLPEGADDKPYPPR